LRLRQLVHGLKRNARMELVWPGWQHRAPATFFVLELIEKN
jgi:hypothetical protein